MSTTITARPDPETAASDPESWCCVDCGINTAPGCSTRADMVQFVKTSAIRMDNGLVQRFDETAEVYMVRAAVWTTAGMHPFGGCLCIGCLERRIGRQLCAKDFKRRHSLNTLPGTPRLLQRQGRAE
jgi:hypothetical protein